MAKRSSSEAAAMDTIFETWTLGGVRFLAVPFSGNGNVTICDENGAFYGSFASVERFRHLQQSGSDMAVPIGNAHLDLYGR